jgi:chromosomal replication initiator protein
MQTDLLISLLEDIKPKIGESSLRDWFSQAYIKYENGYILVFPNDFIANWVRSNYIPQINESAKKIGIDIKISSEDQSNITEKPQISRAQTNFNDRFTFDSFVVGNSNQMAYESALRVAQSKEITFNPLFIHGDVGLGKTHLMHAIANFRAAHFPDQRITYLSAEQFMNLFIRAIQERTVMNFKDEFRSADMLMIDDFQFLGSKEATQEEFFHTLNALLDQKKQLVISADQSPSSLPGVAARLKSRLGWGLVVDIHPATFELRVGILRNKAKSIGAEHISEDIINFIASKVENSIRELEGALIRVIKYSEWMKQPLTIELASSMLKGITSNTSTNTEEMLLTMCRHMEIDISIIKGSGRSREIARARQKAVYILRSLGGVSYVQIAKMMGNKDHSSIIYAESQAKKLKQTDPVFAKQLKNLEDSLK